MEVCALRDAAPRFVKVGARVFGISTDDVAAQAAFAKANGISYPLLADADRKVATRYGVTMSGRPFARRITFIVDPNGIVRHVFERVSVRTHGDDVARVLADLGAAPGGDTGLTGVLDEASFKALHQLKDGKPPRLHGATIDLAGSRAYLSLPKGKGPHPGILVIHEWWGLNDNIKHWSDRLAAAGYAALAVDLYGGKVARTPDDAMKAMRSVDEAAAEKIIAAGLEFLAKDPRVRAPKRAAIGWCFGGGWSLRAALAHPELDAAVIYYGRLKTSPEVLKAIKAKICGIFGNQDRGIPPATVDTFEAALEKADVEHEIYRFDANHAFANPSSARYDEQAASEAWKRVRVFLDRTLRGRAARD